MAGGNPVNNIAKWKGGEWSALGSGTDNLVNTVYADEYNNLYAGGLFTNAGGITANYIAMWNGVCWSTLGSGIETSSANAVNSIREFNGNIFVGGNFQNAGGIPASNIAQWRQQYFGRCVPDNNYTLGMG